MKVSEFLNVLATMDSETKAEIVAKINDEFGPCKRHTEWLADWRAACRTYNDTPDNPKTDEEQSDVIHDLGVRMATEPASTLADLKAQIEWFEEDLGDYVKDNVSPEYRQIFDTLKFGVERVGRRT